MAAAVLSLLALAWSLTHHQLLLYGDAVAHLHIARRVFDTDSPALANLGSVWLPLPHILLIPFAMITPLWRSGLAGAPPSMLSYVAAVVAMFRIARLWLPRHWSVFAAAVFAINPGLLYMQTTAMTEPLFLALFLWSLVFTAEFLQAVDAEQPHRAVRPLMLAGLLLVGAVLSRYDGWVLAACIGLLLLSRLRKVLAGPARLRWAAVAFTMMLCAAPLAWLWFNARYFHDPLDFLRGPYSARAIEARTALPGHAPHPGYHRPRIALRYYLRAATLGAVEGNAGNVAMVVLAFAGTVIVIRKPMMVKTVQPKARLNGVALLLWFPLAFYTYSVAYGSVPIFMPIWPPHSYYNTRYGMELLPALALFPATALFAISTVFPWFKKLQHDKLWLGTGYVAALANAVLLAASTPLVLQEARANSATRIPFERALAAAIEPVRADQTLLMYTSAYAGALQDAGRPLRETIQESDYYAWPAALENPAAHADYVLAVDGDPVAAAVAAHPEQLNVAATITCQGQPRAILYRSRENTRR